MSPQLFKQVNGWLAVAWFFAIPVFWVFGWLSLTVLVSAVSLYTVVFTHLSSWMIAEVEIVQQDQMGDSG